MATTTHEIYNFHVSLCMILLLLIARYVEIHVHCACDIRYKECLLASFETHIFLIDKNLWRNVFLHKILFLKSYNYHSTPIRDNHALACHKVVKGSLLFEREKTISI
jgi:hypothetical protein